jgi:hypothetical protein
LRSNALKFVRRRQKWAWGDDGAIVEGLAEADTPELATRAELVSATPELKAVLKAEFAALRTDMVETKPEIFRCTLLQAVGIIGLTVTLVKLLP